MSRKETDMVEIKNHYIQIEACERRVTTAYRYYGMGRWETKRHEKWEPINGIYVPGLVLKVAALYCEKTRPEPAPDRHTSNTGDPIGL